MTYTSNIRDATQCASPHEQALAHTCDAFVSVWLTRTHERAHTTTTGHACVERRHASGCIRHAHLRGRLYGRGGCTDKLWRFTGCVFAFVRAGVGGISACHGPVRSPSSPASFSFFLDLLISDHLIRVAPTTHPPTCFCAFTLYPTPPHPHLPAHHPPPRS